MKMPRRSFDLSLDSILTKPDVWPAWEPPAHAAKKQSPSRLQPVVVARGSVKFLRWPRASHSRWSRPRAAVLPDAQVRPRIVEFNDFDEFD